MITWSTIAVVPPTNKKLLIQTVYADDENFRTGIVFGAISESGAWSWDSQTSGWKMLDAQYRVTHWALVNEP